MSWLLVQGLHERTLVEIPWGDAPHRHGWVTWCRLDQHAGDECQDYEFMMLIIKQMMILMNDNDQAWTFALKMFLLNVCYGCPLDFCE